MIKVQMLAMKMRKDAYVVMKSTTTAGQKQDFFCFVFRSGEKICARYWLGK